MSCFGSQNSKPGYIRQLGALETQMSTLIRYGLYRNVAVTCRYAVPDSLKSELRGQSIQQLLEQAVSSTVLDHPLLLVGVEDVYSKKPWWKKLESIELRKQIQWRTLADHEDNVEVLTQTLEAQHDMPFDHDLEPAVQWRIVVLSPTDSSYLEVLFVYNHTPADGMSGAIFHQTLLEKLNAASSGATCPHLHDGVLTIPDIKDFTPPSTKLIKFPLSIGFVVKEGRQLLAGYRKNASDPYTVSWAPVQRSPYKTKTSIVRIADHLLQPILAVCRQRKTTLTGLIHALCLLSLASRLPADTSRAFQSGTPISQRRFIPPKHPRYPGIVPDRLMGNIVTYFTYKYDEDTVAKLRSCISQTQPATGWGKDVEDIVWDQSKNFREALSTRLKAGTKDDIVGLAKYITDWGSYMEARLKGARNVSWEVSNLGVLNSRADSASAEKEDGRQWVIKEACFSQSAAVTGPAIQPSVAAVKGGSLTFHLSWQEGVVDEQLARGMASDLESWLSLLGRYGHLQGTEEK